MSITSRPFGSFARRVAFLPAFLAMPIAAQAHHTTDHTNQQLEYERQQREYWRAQEQRRQEEQRLRQIEQETVRRREEQSQRERSQYQSAPRTGESAPAGGTARAPGGASPQSARPTICTHKPVDARERNVLVGRWQYVQAQAGAANLFAQMYQMACPAFAGGFDFRERTLIAQGKPVPASYGRDGDVWWVCTGSTAVSFRAVGANRLQMIDPTPGCTFERVRTGASR